MDGAELLQRVRETYAGFETYSDVGTVESPGLPGPGMEFQTQFKRPLNFRFHWLSWHPKFGKDRPAKKSTVCSNGKIFRGDYSSEISSCDSFSMMIASATGVSRGSVHTIMSLLMPGELELSHSWHDMS